MSSVAAPMGNRMPPLFYRMLICVILIGMLTVTGCMFADLKKEIKEEKNNYGMEGRVIDVTGSGADVIVLLYKRQKDSLQLDRFTLTDGTGTFSFIVTAGTYLLAGFEDCNANQRHDPNEPAGIWNDGADIVVFEGPKTEARREALTGLNFKLTPGQFPITGAVASVENVDRLSVSLLKLGQLADWDDPIFDDANGSIGFWKPMTFLRQFGAGVYFLEPYDREKIPILFIHGANGTPRGWKYLADGLDKRLFQPWVLYYPSGARLERVAMVLNEIIKRLQITYGFDRMGVVAHSMGGLVARAFILQHLIDDGLGTVRVFVSISTPWGGVYMAAKGLEHAPEAVPSWHDVAPQSEFIQSIFKDSLRPQVLQYLIFGYRGNCSLFTANNDGTVEVSSELEIRAQKDAAAMRGLDEDHMSILFSDKTMTYMNEVIAAAFPKSEIPLQ